LVFTFSRQGFKLTPDRSKEALRCLFLLETELDLIAG